MARGAHRLSLRQPARKATACGQTRLTTDPLMSISGGGTNSEASCSLTNDAPSAGVNKTGRRTKTISPHRVMNCVEEKFLVSAAEAKQGAAGMSRARSLRKNFFAKVLRVLISNRRSRYTTDKHRRVSYSYDGSVRLVTQLLSADMLEARGVTYSLFNQRTPCFVRCLREAGLGALERAYCAQKPWT